MYCQQCGAQLQEDANYCYRCGQAINDPKEPTSGKAEWEYCQIELTYQDDPNHIRRLSPGLFNVHNVCWFYAEEIGIHGKYNAGNSPEFISGTKQTKEESKAKHDQLVQKLLKEGWLPLPQRGNAWWQWRFKRKSNPKI